MRTLIAIDTITRPHFLNENCWCRPTTCECCGGIAHRIPDVRPDTQPRMAVFSDQCAEVTHPS